MKNISVKLTQFIFLLTIISGSMSSAFASDLERPVCLTWSGKPHCPDVWVQGKSCYSRNHPYANELIDNQEKLSSAFWHLTKFLSPIAVISTYFVYARYPNDSRCSFFLKFFGVLGLDLTTFGSAYLSYFARYSQDSVCDEETEKLDAIEKIKQSRAKKDQRDRIQEEYKKNLEEMKKRPLNEEEKKSQEMWESLFQDLK